MKKFLILTIALFALSGVSAQQSVDMDLQGTKTVSVVLTGPSIQSVPLSLEVTFQPEKELLHVVMKYDDSWDGSRISSTKKNTNTKDQITHLFFPFNWNGFRYDDIPLKNYIKNTYKSKAVLDPLMKKQISDNNGDVIAPAIVINNGEIVNMNYDDFIFSLKEDQKVLDIKVWDVDDPVTLTINNVIPFHAQKEGTLQSNKFNLKYISNSSAIIFNLPKDKCARQYGLVQQYEKLNEGMKVEADRLKQFVTVNDDDINIIIQRQWPLIYKYERTRKDIAIQTECEELLRQLEIFNNYYKQITGANPLTPDSLRNLIDKLDWFKNRLVNAREGYSCRKLKREAVKYMVDADFDENVFDTLSEAYSLIHQFNELKKDIEGFKCPVDMPKPDDTNDTSSPPVTTPKSSQCNCKKFSEAADKINHWDNQYWANGMNNKPAFNILVAKMDAELKSLPASCKNDQKCMGMINQYIEAKKMFLENVK